jgi:hypothetical protein
VSWETRQTILAAAAEAFRTACAAAKTCDRFDPREFHEIGPLRAMTSERTEVCNDDKPGEVHHVQGYG